MTEDPAPRGDDRSGPRHSVGGPSGARTGAGPRTSGEPRTGAPRGGGPRTQGAAGRGGAPRGGARGPAAPRGAAAGPRPPRDDAPSRPRRQEPALPDDVTGRELDRDVRAELTTLAKDNAEVVARHLVMAGRLLDVDPELAHSHAMAATLRAGRVGAVREAAGLTAYATGRHADALRELRTARRLTGSVEHLPVMADSERGRGRPERALALAASPEVRQLDERGRAEMRIVASGARLDLGQPDAAVVVLQAAQLAAAPPQPWHARTFVAHADALRAAGRGEEAAAWERRAAAVDPERASGAWPPAAPGGSAVEDEEPVVVYDAETPDVPFGHDRAR